MPQSNAWLDTSLGTRCTCPNTALCRLGESDATTKWQRQTKCTSNLFLNWSISFRTLIKERVANQFLTNLMLAGLPAAHATSRDICGWLAGRSRLTRCICCQKPQTLDKRRKRQPEGGSITTNTPILIISSYLLKSIDLCTKIARLFS
jgi:hypothetical protein